jgi:serine/threonine protein kinase
VTVSERCPACDAVVDDTNVAAGGPLRCDRCGTRFPKPRPRVATGSIDAKTGRVATPPKKDEVDVLGIHPALAKKYRDRVSNPPSPSEVGAEIVNDTAPEPPSDSDAFPGSSHGSSPFDGALPHAPPLKRDTRVLAEDPGTTNPGRPAPRRSGEGAVPVAKPQVAQPAATARAPVQQAKPAGPTPDARGEPMPLIGGYDVIELVGKGAMGRVYRAVQRATHAMSAIKILAPELAARVDFIQRFEREGAAMRAVNHPGVVAVMDAGNARQPDGSTAHYICMEFVEGPPLRRSLDKGALSPEIALRYARLIIQGLGAAHQRGVIHRDLKPENILVQSDERLVLVDFGLAGMLDEENDPHPNLTKSRMTMGTVNYMAPEQRTDAKRVDQRADLYAAGVILYELLTGDLPLGRFALPTERGVPVPLSVDRCIVRALARNPEERYQRAEKFDEELAAIEAELRRTAGQETVIGRSKAPPTTNRKSSIEEIEDLGPRVLVPSFSGAPSLATPWVTAVPWINRSLLTWAAVALGIGALLGVLLKACS